MRATRRRILAVAIGITLAACQDAAPPDPGGMGAGRPEAEPSGETPAAQVLDQANTPGAADSTGAGGATTTGALRDSLHR